jgi:hypothetical protein
MRYKCHGCGEQYGEGTNKPHNGFCSGCWDKYLAQCKHNTEKLQAEWEKTKAEPKPAYIPVKVKKPAWWWPLRWWKVKFILISLALRINVKVCGLLRVPVCRYIIPRIRLRIPISRN